MKKILTLVSFSLFAGLGFSQGDECANAETITPTFTQCTFQAGSSGNGTQSMPTCSGGGNADDDVWYSFVANSSEMDITVSPTVGYDAVIQLFSGTCGSLTSIHCQDVNGLNGLEVLQASGLTPGNTYYFRVYHYGVGSGTSTFQVCVTGLAPPDNNEPCSAYALPEVTPSCNYLTFTNAGSLGSAVATPSGCGGSSPYQGGYAGGDVWFSVVVPASGQLDIHTAGVDFSDGAMALYSGPCGSPSLVACDDDGEPGDGILMPHIYQTGLTPGATMFIRVWEYGNNNNGEFEICVTSPDNDDCVNAQQICDLNGYGGVTSSAYTIDTPDNMCGIGDPGSPIPGCVFGTGYTGVSPVQIDNNSWLQFTASATTAELFVEISSCQNGNGMQMQIFEGTNCTNFVPVSNFLETTTSQTVLATGLTIGNTYYIVVDGFAGDICSYTISATSGVQVVEAVAIDEFICDGQSTDISAIITGTGPYTYSWSSVPVGFSSANATETVTPAQNTEYIVEVQGFCGTTTTASVYVTVNDNPVANAGSNQTICDNESANITATANGGNGTYTYNWDIPATGASQTVSPNSTTTYNVTVTDGNGCTDTDAITVNVNAAPTANAGTDQAICNGQTATLTASGGTTYSWSSGGGSATEMVSPTSNTIYTVTVGNAAGCQDTDDVLVTVNPLPNAFAGNDITVCNGGSASITATGGVSYMWDGGLGAGATQNLTNITSPVTYTVTVTDANGCVDTDDIFIDVGAALTPDAGADTDICEGESHTLSASGGINYSWDNGLGTGSTHVVTPTSTTTYTVNVDDGGGCSGSATVTITVNANPTADAGVDQTICAGDVANLSANGGTSYTWDNGLGSGQNQSVSPSTTTTYIVTVSNADGCTDTDDIVVIVNALPSILASADQTICLGESADITANGTGISTYNWANSSGSNFPGQNVTVTPAMTSTFTVTGTDANGCTAADSLVITVNDLPQIDTSSIQVNNGNCVNGGGTISGITIIGTPDYTYLWNDGLNNVGNTLSVGNLLPGTYSLLVTDGNGCENTILVTVNFSDLSLVAANDDYASTFPNTIVTVNAYTNDTGDVNTITIIDQPIGGSASYLGNGEFEYTPNAGFIGLDSIVYEICDPVCVSECERATIYIEVNGEQDVVIPNGFTPNNDGFNDTFVILHLEQYPDNNIVIFNRWGDKVFEAAPYLNDWDGSSDGAKMKVMGDSVVDGTYFFVLDLGNGEEPINGYIDLRRK
ncbi:gliding motility-associated C-terminal domain-containing protein [Paracrocinitomix mangrovi]|uniref:T9SS type B sorting domain-containing protein n=1 Tax=Paracrocinitomix mangrovi TaxID=2862509 RepID=UPI001C8E0B86|nr:gliding motility-associated C-terminal domain-containing protein [Paracrocinitomix mangrovi]UKN00828.1 gliding motility-associated C-terminal domain-containing protein [Paracrocinitomix mangrovi]